MDLNDLKSQWNEILDLLERRNRIAWLVYFDGRLSSLDENVLRLDFRDAAKLAGGHDFGSVRNPEHREALERVIKEVIGEAIRVEEI